MLNKVESSSDGMGDAVRCLLCGFTPKGRDQWVMKDHIRDHVEADEITEQMMLEQWKNKSEGE